MVQIFQNQLWNVGVCVPTFMDRPLAERIVGFCLFSIPVSTAFGGKAESKMSLSTALFYFLNYFYS